MNIFEKKFRIVKLLVSLSCFISDCIFRTTARLLGRMPDATCVVLYYHSVPGVQRQAFAHQMNIVANLTIPISIERVPQLAPGKRYSCVTFDDGFENIIANALPELQKRGIPATVFLTTAYLGQPAGWWPADAPQRGQRIATAEIWQQLPTGLISVGSHTLTHPHLLSLAEKEARRELFESRLILEQLLNREIRTFSFPYGEFSTDLVDWCRDAGYKRIFTTLPRNAFHNPKEFVSGRVNVEPADWPLEFRLKLLGAYRWLPFAIFWKRRILSWIKN